MLAAERCHADDAFCLWPKRPSADLWHADVDMHGHVNLSLVVSWRPFVECTRGAAVGNAEIGIPSVWVFQATTCYVYYMACSSSQGSCIFVAFHVLSSCQCWVGVLEKVEVKGVVKGWIMLVGKESLSTDPGMVGCRSAK